MEIFYVYGLYDPVTNNIFYIGKGSENRDKSHLKPSLWKYPKKTSNPFLYYKIKSLMEQNTIPNIVRIKENITEQEAYTIENELIKKHGRRFIDNDGILFNLSDYKGGSVKGKKTTWTKKRKIEHVTQCKNRRRYDPTYEELYNDYIKLGKTRKYIAKENKCSEVLVKKRLSHYGILKPKEKIYPKKNMFSCMTCNKDIIVPHSVKSRKYCSHKCKGIYNDAKKGRNTISFE